MTRSQIIELANTRTEGRAKTLNLKLEFLNALQEFCLESRFYWRKKSITFNTASGTATYDLSSSDAQLEEIISVRYVENATSVHILEPLFDTQAIEELQEATTTGKPGTYNIEPGTSQTLRIGPIPSGIYKMRTTAWAVPVVDPEDDSAETIPLVPAWLHRTIAKLLERNILGFLYGEENARFARADAEYQKQLQQAMARRDGMIGKVVEYKSREDAIRST
jgi:hypothetical protein